MHVSGERPYKCSTCNAGFNDPSCRRRHEREHTLMKPYVCHMCHESFKRQGQLKAHLSRKHTTDGIARKDNISVVKTDDGEMHIIVNRPGFSKEVVIDTDGVELAGSSGQNINVQKQKKIVKLISDLNSSMLNQMNNTHLLNDTRLLNEESIVTSGTFTIF